MGEDWWWFSWVTHQTFITLGVSAEGDWTSWRCFTSNPRGSFSGASGIRGDTSSRTPGQLWPEELRIFTNNVYQHLTSSSDPKVTSSSCFCYPTKTLNQLSSRCLMVSWKTMIKTLESSFYFDSLKLMCVFVVTAAATMHGGGPVQRLPWRLQAAGPSGGDERPAPGEWPHPSSCQLMVCRPD